jgi:uncharacterized protein
VSRRNWIEATAAVTLVSLLAASCSFGSSKHATKKETTPPTTVVAPTPTRTLIVSPEITAGIRPTTDRTLNVAFVENKVGSTADQWQAAGWNAVTTATLLTGVPLDNREIDFTVTGPIDGVSAGALMTVATIALIQGAQLEPDITMTGAINPDGGIGPVSNVPAKLAAAVQARKTRFVIPEGQLDTVDASGKPVDVGALGAQKHVSVVEAGNIYDAYKLFTGTTLPRLPASKNTALDSGAYAKLRAKVETWTAKYAAALSDFKTLSPTVQQDLNPYATTALLQEVQARQLGAAGQQAGAFSAAVNATALMRSVTQTGQSFPMLLTDGAAPFVAKIEGNNAIQGQISGLVDSLKTFTPKTVTDMSALLAAYGNAIDAASLVKYAQYLFKAKAASESDTVSQVAQGAIYYGLAGSLVEAGSDLLAAAQGLGGANLGPIRDVGNLTGLLRQAANANLQAFQTGVVAPLAGPKQMSVNATVDAFARADTGYALAGTGNAILQSLPAYFGNGTPAAYAQLGGAISLYVRSTVLLAKYRSLGHVNPTTLQLAGMANGGRAFNVSIQHAQTQLTSNLGLLRSKQVNPTTVAADVEIARVDQNGDVEDKFDALGDYWDGYVNSRVLAALGGFAQP